MSSLIEKWSNRPFRVMYTIVFIIIAVEGLIMYLLETFQGLLSPFAAIAFDSLVLASILSPVLYYLVVAPLKQQISERTQAGKDLRANKLHFRQLLDSVDGVVWEADPATFAFTFVSLKAEEILGYPVQQWLRETTFWADHIHPDDRDWAVALCVSATMKKHNHVFEYRMIAADGHIVWLRDLVTVVTDDSGNIVNLRGLMVDITEKKQLESELINACNIVVERNHFTESVINNIQSGIIVLDPDWQITTINLYAAAFSGEEPDELIGKHFPEVSHELYVNILAGNTTNELAVSIFSKQLTIGYTCFSIRDDQGKVTGTILAFKDLTEIVKMRARMRQKQRLADMGEVIARVAHEMRNPLFGISSSAQILEMELSLEPGQQLLMDSLLRESRRLNKLVDELLESTKEVRINKQRVSLSRIIDASVKVMDSVLMDKGVRLLQKLPAAELFINADFEKIEQVVINLVNNAIEASSRGKTVELSVSSVNGDVVITVEDQGEGIKEEVFGKIFDVFYTTKKSGTGLGLSISRNIVEAHRGTLAAVNNPAGGATFTISLPAAAEIK